MRGTSVWRQILGLGVEETVVEAVRELGARGFEDEVAWLATKTSKLAVT